MPQVSMIQNIVGGWDTADVRISNLSDSVNMFPETSGEGASTTSILRSISGSTKLLELGGKCRGLFQASRDMEGKPILFAVFGHSLYVIRSVEGVYQATELTNDLTNSPDQVGMCETGGEGSAHPHLIVVDGSNVWAVNTELDDAGMLQDIRTIALPYRVRQENKDKPTIRIQPTHCAYCYNYLIVNDKDTDAFYTSYQYPFERTNSDDEVDYDIFMINSDRPGEIGYKDYGFVTYSEWSPDNTTALCTNNTLLYTFGPKSTQIFTYNSDVDAPFVSPTNCANSIGIKAPHSLSFVGDFVFWLGSSAIGENGIYQWKGNQLSKISTPDVERKINNMDNPSDATGQCWTENGHLFYALTFSDDDYTLVYDLTEGLWHRRSSRDARTNQMHAWRLGFAQLHDSKLMFGTPDGCLVYLDYTKFEEYDGRPMLRIRRSGMLMNNFQYFTVDRIKLICNAGDFVNNELLQKEYSPQIMMRYSDSGGDWSNQEIGLLGEQGQYQTDVDWFKLGVHKVLCIEFSMSDNVNFCILGGQIKYSLIDR